LKGAEPDAALKARISAFQTRQQNGAQELQRQQDQIKRNQQYVQKQIADKLGPIYSQVMQRRGANIMVEQGATLATATSLYVTTDVIGALNTAMPTIQTVAPAAPANTTQGR
jgi:Skp family chaperone for outer membrane proteins